MTIAYEAGTKAPLDLSVDQALENARTLRARLIEEQAETEARTRHSPEVNDALIEAGVYHMLRPRTFGGYEFSLTDFLKVIAVLAEGDMSTAWNTCLGAGHALQVASWFPEHVQKEVFAGHFCAPMVGAPGGTLTRTNDGYELTGTFPYSSGVPYATHFVGHAFTPDPEGNPGPGVTSVFMAPRGTWTMLEDWGATLGLKGSGSNTIVFERAHIPEDWVLEGKSQFNMDVDEPTPGLRLHGNPMYGGRALGFFASELAVMMIGGVRGALQEYGKILNVKKTLRPPVVLRSQDPTYREMYGEAVSKLACAEAVLWNAADRFMETCERAAHGGAPFSEADDVLINMMAREAMFMAWSVMEGIIFRSAGTSAIVNGSRLERIWRDTSQTYGHFSSNLRLWMARRYAELTLPTP